MVRSISATQQGTQSHWAVQVSKSVGLAVSSTGLGWLLSKLWRGSELSLGSPKAIQQGQSACLLGLFGGALGTAVSGNPAALALGSSFCLPAAAAESTIPSHSVLDDRATTYFKSAVKALESKSPIIRKCNKETWQEIRAESARYGKFATALFLDRLKISSRIIHLFEEKTIDPAELPYIKSYLQELDQILSADIKAQVDLKVTLDAIVQREPNWRDFSKQVTDLFSKLNEHYTDFQKKLRTFVTLLEDTTEGQIKTSAQECVHSLQKLLTQIYETKLSDDASAASLLSVLNREVLYRASEVYLHNQEILAQKNYISELYSAGLLSEALKQTKELKELSAKEIEHRSAFERDVRVFERATSIFSLLLETPIQFLNMSTQWDMERSMLQKQ